MALCTVTGTIRLPNGQAAKSRTVWMKRTGKDVVATADGVVLPEDIITQTNATGGVTFVAYTGLYAIFVEGKDGGYAGTAAVPDSATASLIEILTVGPIPPVPPLWYEALKDQIDVVSQDVADAQQAASEAQMAAGEALTNSDNALLISGQAQTAVAQHQPWIDAEAPYMRPSGIVDSTAWSPKEWTNANTQNISLGPTLADMTTPIVPTVGGQVGLQMAPASRVVRKATSKIRSDSWVLLVARVTATEVMGQNEIYTGVYHGQEGAASGGTSGGSAHILTEGENILYRLVTRSDIGSSGMVRPYLLRASTGNPATTVIVHSLQAIEFPIGPLPLRMFWPLANGTDFLPAFNKAVQIMGTISTDYIRGLDLGGSEYRISGPIDNPVSYSKWYNGSIRATGTRTDYVGGTPDSRGVPVQKGAVRLIGVGQKYYNITLHCGVFEPQEVVTANSTYTIYPTICNGFEDCVATDGGISHGHLFEDCLVNEYDDFAYRYASEDGNGFDLLHSRARHRPPQQIDGMMNSDANMGAGVLLDANDGRVIGCGFLNGLYPIWQTAGGTIELTGNHPWVGASCYGRRYFGTVGTVIPTGIQVRTLTQIGTISDPSKVNVYRRETDWQVMVEMLETVTQANAVQVNIRRDEICAKMDGWGSNWVGNYVDGGTIRSGQAGLRFHGGFGLAATMSQSRGTYPPTMRSTFEFYPSSPTQSPPEDVHWVSGSMGGRILRYPRLGQTSWSEPNARFSDATLIATGGRNQSTEFTFETLDTTGKVSTFRSSGALASIGIAHKAASDTEVTRDFSGVGSPEGAVAAPVGSTYRRRDADMDQRTIYIKTSGTGNSGWRMLAYTNDLGILDFKNNTAGGATAAIFRSANGEATVNIGIAHGGATDSNMTRIYSGPGIPEGVVTAPVGSVYLRRNGTPGATFYVKESGTGNTGWNVAQRSIAPTPMEYGAVGDGIANDTAAVQAWLNAGKNLRMVGKYAITGPVTASVPGTRVTGDGSLIWRGALRVEAGVIVSGAGSSIDGIELDGRDLLGKGIHITGDNCPVRKCHIHNMRSETQTAVGIYATSLVGAEISGNHIHHIHSVGNGTTGDANGAARSVLIQASTALISPYDVVDNDVHDITGEEGDGIQILLLTGSTFLSAAKTRIARNRVRQCSKRTIKVQAHDVIVDGNVALLDMDGSYSAIDIINSSRCTVRDNDVTVTAADGRGIQYASFDPATFGRCADGVVESNRVVTPAGAAHLGIYALLTDRPNVSGNTVTGGRVVLDDCAAPIADRNVGIDMVLSGSDGLVSIRNNCVAPTARDNILTSGGGYTCVRVDAPGSVVMNNRNLSTTHNAASAAYVTSGGNVLTGNTNAKPAVPVINYSGATNAAAQVAATGNFTV